MSKTKSNRKPATLPPKLPWVDRTNAARWPFDTVRPTACYVDSSNRWTVQVFPEPEAKGWHRVGIKCFTTSHRNEQIRVNWSAIQSIKESLFPGRLALEIYPAPDDVVDVAPMRWLWIAPRGWRLPFHLSGEKTELVG